MPPIRMGPGQENNGERVFGASVVRGRGGRGCEVSDTAVDLATVLTRSSVFEGSNIVYPTRRVTHEDNGDAKMGS